MVKSILLFGGGGSFSRPPNMEFFQRSTFPSRAHTLKISRRALASPQTSFGVRLSQKWMRDKRTPKDVCGEASRAPENCIVSTLLSYGSDNNWSDLTLILTFAGTWYPDKTTSSSKNLALPVTLGVSLERKNVIFRVKVSCTRQTINWVMLRSPKLHRVIYLSSWKILIIVDIVYMVGGFRSNCC